MVDKSKKIRFDYIVVAVLAMAVAVFATMSITDRTRTADSSDSGEYIETLEKKLAKTVSKIDGVKSATVLITVSDGVQEVLATETKTVNVGNSTTTTVTPVTINGKTVIIGETIPKITGAVIVAKGSDNLTVRLRILNAVMTALSVPSDKIQILPG